MKFDIVVAGVGGQGVRSTAAILAASALHAGLEVLQSHTAAILERPGSAVVHIRTADHAIDRETILPGEADLVLALEPLDAARSLELLSPGGAVISATEPVPNVPGYPEVNDLLWSILKRPAGFIIDANRIARQAGGIRAANVVLVGAAADFLPVEPENLRRAVADLFESFGPRVVEVNLAAFDAGRQSLRHRELVDEFDTFTGICH
jgi:indolepyruvate ferredoxin oxidoreductase, beta subunit